MTTWWAPRRRCSAFVRACRTRIRASIHIRRGAVAAIAALTLGACDFPTAPPRFETRLLFPGETSSLAVNQLLPSSVTVSGSNFSLSVPAPAPFSRSLAAMCPPCAAFQGFTVPFKPAFADSFNVVVSLPADVSSATITSGSVTVTMSHNFGFDPLRPPGATTDGRITATARSDTRIVGSAQLDPPFASGGAPITRTITLAPGVITGDIVITIAMISPEGGQVTISSNPSFNVSVTPGVILVSEANVRVGPNRPVTVDSTAVDLSEIDEAIRDRVKSGVLIVNTSNPFDITGTMTLRILGGTQVVTKTVPIRAGTATEQIAFTQAELQSILGRDVVMTATGTITGGAAGVTVRPGQVVTINTRLGLVLEVGG